MRIIIILVILVSTFNYSATENKTYKTTYQNRIEIEAINKRIEQLYINENSDSLISFYTPHLTFFAEYMPAIFERKTLKKIYKDWFKVINVKTYKKEIYKVEVLSDYLLDYKIYRNNSLIGEVDSAHLNYTDSLAGETPSYEYKISVVNYHFKESELSASVLLPTSLD